MNATLTIELTDNQYRQLQETAKELKKSEAELISRWIEARVAMRKLGERIGHLAGALEASPEESDPLIQGLRERNWRS